jgi:hypothetical protein
MKFFHLNLRLPLAVLLAPNAVAGDHVIIVGAGAAGMSAAKTLLELDSSVDITILEATDRIGGRVKTVQLGDTRVEMGAEEHYGPKVLYDQGGNPIYEALTTKYGTDIYTDADSFSTVYAMPPSPNRTCGTISYGPGTGLAKNCADDSDWKKFIGIYDWFWVSTYHEKRLSRSSKTCFANIVLSNKHRNKLHSRRTKPKPKSMHCLNRVHFSKVFEIIRRTEDGSVTTMISGVNMAQPWISSVLTISR